MKNQKGFTVIEGLLVVIAITLISGVGYYVYNSNQTKQTSNTDAQEATNNNQSSQDSKNEIPDNWKSYESSAYSLKHPSDWIDMQNQENCPDIFGRGTVPGSEGICQSDSGPQISITTTTEPPVTFKPTEEYSSDIVTSTAEIDGVSATRYSSISKGTAFEDEGTKNIIYIFSNGKTTYVATYNDGNKKYKNVENEFDLMMTKSFKFK